jgi:protein-disulfide isomerase-like protein with CxxC motif
MRVGIKAQKKLFAKPRKKLLSSIWNNCYKDGRRLARCLGLDALNLSPTLTQAEIASMLDAGAALEPQRSHLGVDQMAVLPINLMAPLSTENAALVTKAQRQRLFARLRSVHKFLKAKQSEGKPVDAYREQLESVWRRHVESVSILPR